ncbi:MAG: hypothetical protein ABI113_21100 [Mucilaginibacter sp.]
MFFLNFSLVFYLDRLGSGGKTIESMDEGWGQILHLYKNLVAQPNT